MPRYFFNMVSDITIHDLEGTELSSLEAAKAEAQKDIDEITQIRFEMNRDWSKWAIEICDQDGALLLVVPFSSN